LLDRQEVTGSNPVCLTDESPKSSINQDDAGFFLYPYRNITVTFAPFTPYFTPEEQPINMDLLPCIRYKFLLVPTMESALKDLCSLSASPTGLQDSLFQHLYGPPEDTDYPFEDYVKGLLAQIEFELVDKNEQTITRSIALIKNALANLNIMIKTFKKEIPDEPKFSLWKGSGKGGFTADEMRMEVYWSAMQSAKAIRQFLSYQEPAEKDKEEDTTEQPVVKSKVTASADPKIPDNDFLITEDVCRLLRVHKRTVVNYRKAGKLRFIKTGRIIYYKREDVDTYINQHKRQTE
jgi:excisionase family DNA binding protein